MKWKWNKGTFVAVIAIMSISFIYSGIKSKQLSKKIEEEKLKVYLERLSLLALEKLEKKDKRAIDALKEALNIIEGEMQGY